ncbi:hypothetical protein GF357_01085 [Candidatus Dojkabacteria bacterium]|nr:hypothetical protein [Candidatus Dojkabacteria bacterium]
MFFSLYLLNQTVFWIDRILGIKLDNGELNQERSKLLQKRFDLYKWVTLLYLVTNLILVAVFFPGFLVFDVLILTAGMSYSRIFKGLTRYIPMFKNFFVAFFFVIEIAVIGKLPSASSFLTVYDEVVFLGTILAQSLIAQSLFDFKDISEDRKLGLKTLPVLFGKKNAVIMIQVLNFGVFIAQIALWGLTKGTYHVMLSLVSLYNTPFILLSLDASRFKILYLCEQIPYYFFFFIILAI